MRNVKISYSDESGVVHSFYTDYCSGEIPAGSRTLYWNFYCGYDDRPDLRYPRRRIVARVDEHMLLPESKDKAKRLFGRPWSKKFFDAGKIVLTPYEDCENRSAVLPDDCQQVWEVNHDSDAWVIECPDRAILRIVNNQPKVRRGTFHEALMKLFPRQPIEVNYVIRRVDIKLLNEHLKR